jgi:hypothetical protein
MLRVLQWTRASVAFCGIAERVGRRVGAANPVLVRARAIVGSCAIERSRSGDGEEEEQ